MSVMLLMVFGLTVAIGNTQPVGDNDDFEDPGKLSYGLKYSEELSYDVDESDPPVQSSESGHANYDSGIFTKYPDSPNDDYQPPTDGELPKSTQHRKKSNSTDAETQSIDVNRQFFENVYNVSRPERKVDEQIATVPLRGLISAIESQLINTAGELSAKARRRRSTATADFENLVKQNSTESDESIDVNKNFLEGIFEFTRPQRESEDANVKIPLNGLVSAVESSLIKSAQHFKEPVNQRKRDVHVADVDGNHSDSDHQFCRSARDADDTSGEKPLSSSYHVQKLSPVETIDLNLLNPIIFKRASSDSQLPTSSESNQSDEEVEISTTEFPIIQKTNLTVVQSSISTQLIPGTDKKLAHVQHQQIEKTVFHSSLAIFPTIPPHIIKVPLPGVTTTEEIAETTTEITDEHTSDLEKHDKLLQQTLKLKEKVAEIQAAPVILSQI